jgi:hypothetical protein
LHSTHASDILFILNKNAFEVGTQLKDDIGFDKQRENTTTNVPIFSASTPSNPNFLAPNVSFRFYFAKISSLI